MALSPGHSAPAPSAPQSMPKLVSGASTANFIAFSDTRASGRRTRTPAPATRTMATVPPMTARPRRCWLAPTVTMKATSSPFEQNTLEGQGEGVPVGHREPAAALGGAGLGGLAHEIAAGTSSDR
jgi:hypothetical protein